MAENRKRGDERALEKEEEDYFNEDRYVFGVELLYEY